MFWLNFASIVLIISALIIVVRLFLRKTFNIEKEEKAFFSYNYINDFHKKIDWAIRITSIITLIITFYLIIYQDYSLNLFLIALVIFTGIDYAVRAFFEWRYTQNPKQSILTISEMFILVIALIIIIQFDLLNTVS